MDSNEIYRRSDILVTATLSFNLVAVGAKRSLKKKKSRIEWN